MFYIPKTIPPGIKLVPFLESAGQIYPETVLTFEATNYVLASVINSRTSCVGLRGYGVPGNENDESIVCMLVLY